MVEAELKLRIPSQEAYDAAVAAAGWRADSGRRLLHNSFFDTASEALRAADLHVRLRREAEAGTRSVRWIITVKGAKRKSTSTRMNVRPEEEVCRLPHILPPRPPFLT